MNYFNSRLFVEKKEDFQVEAQSLKHDLNTNLYLNIKHLRLINVYDIFNADAELLEKAKNSVFSEPVTDEVFTEIDLAGLNSFAI